MVIAEGLHISMETILEFLLMFTVLSSNFGGNLKLLLVLLGLLPNYKYLPWTKIRDVS